MIGKWGGGVVGWYVGRVVVWLGNGVRGVWQGGTLVGWYGGTGWYGGGVEWWGGGERGSGR